MKAASASFLAEINNTSNTLRYFLLVAIYTDPVIAYTNLPYDITMSDGITYVSSAKFIAADPSKQASVLDRSEYRIALSGIDNSIETRLMESGFSAPFVVRAGCYITTNGVMQPRAQIGNTITIYNGLVDTWSFKANPGESLELAVQGTNPMGMLDWTNPYYTSVASVKRFRANDTSMDFIGQLNEEEITVRWGKKA